MGNNTLGELGDGTYSNAYFPEQILAGDVIAIAAGAEHSFFLKNDGSLWGMGFNGAGNLGDGTFNNTNRPELIVAAPLNIANVSLAGSDLLLNGVNGIAGTTNYVLTSTNMTLPADQWTRIATNVLNAGGNFTVTFSNAVNSGGPQRFYILQSQ